MSTFLLYFGVITLIIALAVVINEKTVKIPTEIALLSFSLLIGITLKIFISTKLIPPMDTIMENITTVSIDELLLDAILCFMLFSGASDLKFNMLKKQFKPIALLALLTTLLTAFIYAGLFFLLFTLFGFEPRFEICLLCGAIVSPTDPIAATSILNKLGLPEDVVAVMEGESLFNDGTGVALFVFVKGLVTGASNTNFFLLMAWEIVGAIVIGSGISILCALLIRVTKKQVNHIVISLFAVSACYTICELVGCSGVIASVICGIYFTTVIENYKEKGFVDKEEHTYESFWSTIDKLLNYVLYVFIGLSFVSVVKVHYLAMVAIAAIIINLLSRFAGVYGSLVLMKKVPGGYTKSKFAVLMTWSGLKGGLSLALVMSIVEIVPQPVYEIILFITFGTIVFTSIVQGLTVDKLYLRMQKKMKGAQSHE